MAFRRSGPKRECSPFRLGNKGLVQFRAMISFLTWLFAITSITVGCHADTEERKREINHTASDEDATLDWELYNYFSSCEVYNDYGAIKRTRGSCFFSHLFFVGICAKSFCLKTQETQGMYVRSGCQVVQSQGDLIFEGFEPILLPLAFSTYFAAQISRCTGSTWNFVFH